MRDTFNSRCGASGWTGTRGVRTPVSSGLHLCFPGGVRSRVRCIRLTRFPRQVTPPPPLPRHNPPRRSVNVRIRTRVRKSTTTKSTISSRSSFIMGGTWQTVGYYFSRTLSLSGGDDALTASSSSSSSQAITRPIVSIPPPTDGTITTTRWSTRSTTRSWRERRPTFSSTRRERFDVFPIGRGGGRSPLLFLLGRRGFDVGFAAFVPPADARASSTTGAGP